MYDIQHSLTSTYAWLLHPACSPCAGAEHAAGGGRGILRAHGAARSSNARSRRLFRCTTCAGSRSRALRARPLASAAAAAAAAARCRAGRAGRSLEGCRIAGSGERAARTRAGGSSRHLQPLQRVVTRDWPLAFLNLGLAACLLGGLPDHSLSPPRGGRPSPTSRAAHRAGERASEQQRRAAPRRAAPCRRPRASARAGAEATTPRAAARRRKPAAHPHPTPPRDAMASRRKTLGEMTPSRANARASTGAARVASKEARHKVRACVRAARRAAGGPRGEGVTAPPPGRGGAGQAPETRNASARGRRPARPPARRGAAPPGRGAPVSQAALRQTRPKSNWRSRRAGRRGARAGCVYAPGAHSTPPAACLVCHRPAGSMVGAP